MAETQSEFIDVVRLRIGHYVYIDLGWMSHPFPLNSFKIESNDQINVIRKLGLDRIRYSPHRSDPEPEPTRESDAALSLREAGEARRDLDVDSSSGAPGKPSDSGCKALPSLDRRPEQSEAGGAGNRDLIAEQRASLQKCERLFNETSRAFRRIAEAALKEPDAAREAAQMLISSISDKLNSERESCIRLLSEKVGERASLHATNVTIISLLLGRACAVDEATMNDIGVGALLHDLGKAALPERLRYHDANLTSAELQTYQKHVSFGVEMGKKMKLSKGALLVIGQHHECADGSGYPLRLSNDRLTPATRIVSLVDRYDNLCNPSNPAQAMTPYEAMSHIFAQRKNTFDSTTLVTFVRMMGVYPPGSVVQLSDERYALVVSVNPASPLKPRVIIHDESIPREDAPVLDLSDIPSLRIRRSLRPLQLPKATFDYLSPRQRICYFFEHGRSLGEEGQ